MFIRSTNFKKIVRSLDIEMKVLGSTANLKFDV